MESEQTAAAGSQDVTKIAQTQICCYNAYIFSHSSNAIMG